MKNAIIKRKKVDKRIIFKGIVSNAEAVSFQKNAILFVDFRPTNEEYTKYSFPSKNMEYMVSGTPLLTTNLPGMPNEYRDFVYLFEDERVEGMRKKLEEGFFIRRMHLIC